MHEHEYVRTEPKLKLQKTIVIKRLNMKKERKKNQTCVKLSLKGETTKQLEF